MCDTAHSNSIVGFDMITCFCLHSGIHLYLGQLLPVGGVSLYIDQWIHYMVKVLIIVHKYLYIKIEKLEMSATQKLLV